MNLLSPKLIERKNEVVDVQIIFDDSHAKLNANEGQVHAYGGAIILISFYMHRHFMSFNGQFFISCILKVASTLNEILRIQRNIFDINVHCTTALSYYKQNPVSWEESTLDGSLISSQPVETAIIVKNVASKYCDSGKIVDKKTHIH